MMSQYRVTARTRVVPQNAGTHCFYQQRNTPHGESVTYLINHKPNELVLLFYLIDYAIDAKTETIGTFLAAVSYAKVTLTAIQKFIHGVLK